MSLVRAVVATTVLSFTVLAPSGPAVAETLEVVDPVSSDVWQEAPEGGDPQNEMVMSEAGSPTNADVVTTTVKHTAERITLRVKYTELDRTSNIAIAYRGFLKLSSGKVVVLGFWAERAEDWKEHSYLDVVNLPSKPSNGMVGIEQCKDHTAALKFKRDVFTASVSRECLRKPSWAKLFGWARSTEVDDDGNVLREFYDNAESDGWELAETWSSRVKVA